MSPESVSFELGAMSDFESVMSSKADVCQALPFKLIFFVLVDGWSLVAGSLVQSYGDRLTECKVSSLDISPEAICR